MKARISKTTRIVLAVGILVVVLLTLGMAYRGQLEEQSRLNNEIFTARQEATSIPLTQLSATQADLTAQLSASDAEIASDKDILKQSTDVIKVADTLLQIADKNKVALTGISSIGLGDQTVEKVTCNTLPLTLKVEGGMPDIIQFILDMNENFPTGVIKTMDVTVYDTAQNPDKLPTANINLIIYSYEG